MKPRSALSFLLSLFVVVAVSGCTSGGDDEGDDSGDESLSQNACGSLGLGTRIVTGSECSENNSPVVELTLLFPDGRGATCSGSMITNQFVLTAAHCFFERPNRVIVSASGVTVAGEAVTVHPDVRVDEGALSVFNDVAIVRLSDPVTLPTLPIVVSRAPTIGDEIKIFGYGQTEDQSSSNNTVGTLRSGEMRISAVDSNFVDAAYSGEGSNTCSGDSGGPALLEVNGQVGIVALTSSGALVNCSVGDLSRFANVQGTSILDFIVQVVPNVGVI